MQERTAMQGSSKKKSLGLLASNNRLSLLPHPLAVPVFFSFYCPLRFLLTPIIRVTRSAHKSQCFGRSNFLEKIQFFKIKRQIWSEISELQVVKVIRDSLWKSQIWPLCRQLKQAKTTINLAILYDHIWATHSFRGNTRSAEYLIIDPNHKSTYRISNLRRKLICLQLLLRLVKL